MAVRTEHPNHHTNSESGGGDPGVRASYCYWNQGRKKFDLKNSLSVWYTGLLFSRRYLQYSFSQLSEIESNGPEAVQVEPELWKIFWMKMYLEWLVGWVCRVHGNPSCPFPECPVVLKKRAADTSEHVLHLMPCSYTCFITLLIYTQAHFLLSPSFMLFSYYPFLVWTIL